jgi:hypothetical protein
VLANDILLDIASLWVVVFYEIARASMGQTILTRSLDLELTEDSLRLDFTTWYSPPEKVPLEIAAMKGLRLGEGSAEAYQKIIPAKPKDPDGRGWGRRGNYTLVSELLGQRYSIYWKPNESNNQFALCTSLGLDGAVYLLEK